MMGLWRGTMGVCVALLGGCSLVGDVDSPDGSGSDAAVEPCDVDGTWALSGDPVEHTCCLGEIDIVVEEVSLLDEGAEARTLPFPTILLGEPTTCPDGTFDNEGSESGGLCTVGARVTGEFTGADTWDGSFELSFVGCDCGGQDPCTDRTFEVTGTRVD